MLGFFPCLIFSFFSVKLSLRDSCLIIQVVVSGTSEDVPVSFVIACV